MEVIPAHACQHTKQSIHVLAPTPTPLMTSRRQQPAEWKEMHNFFPLNVFSQLSTFNFPLICLLALHLPFLLPLQFFEIFGPSKNALFFFLLVPVNFNCLYLFNYSGLRHKLFSLFTIQPSLGCLNSTFKSVRDLLIKLCM